MATIHLIDQLWVRREFIVVDRSAIQRSDRGAISDNPAVVTFQRLPASLCHHPENIVRPVLVRLFGIGPFAHFSEQPLMSLREGVGEVFQKDQRDHDVLVWPHQACCEACQW